MVASVIKRRLDINYWIAGDNTAIEHFLDAFLNGWAVLLRNHATFDLIDKLKAFASFIWLESNPNVTVLTTTTRLLSMLTLGFSHTLNRFTEGNLWLTDICFNVKLTLHSVDQNL